MKGAEPRRITKRSPGKGLWEQVQVDGELKYAFYYPRDDHHETERIEYDTFNPGETTEEYQTVYKPVEPCPWPLAGEPVEPEEDLWSRIKAYIINHVDLPDERLFDLLTALIYATYIPETFYVVPYIQIIGPKNSGKTRLGEVIQQLCYRGLMSSNISEAALFRSVEEWKPTLILDETEIYSDKDRGSIQNLLNAGYRRGCPAIRMEGVSEGVPRLALFDVFGFKVLIGTGGFKDTLESRAIRISMEKNIRKVAATLDFNEAREIRGQLLMLRFQRLADVARVASVNSVGIFEGVPKGLDFADGRFAELYSPLLHVANEGYESILSYAKEAFRYMVEEEGTSIEAEVVESVINSAPFVESGWISTRSITDKFNEGKPNNEQWKLNSIGRVLKRLGFKPSRRHQGSGYLYDLKRIDRLIERYTLTPRKPTLSTLPTRPDDVTVIDDYATFDAARQQRFNAMTREPEAQ